MFQQIVHNVGIKYYSILNDLKYFHICDNQTGDPMHTVLEGILVSAIKLFLKFVISKNNMITLEEINWRIFNFNYGKLEQKNKPSPIRLDKTGNLIGERAAQNWCLGRFLPLILSDVISSEECKTEWELVTSVLDIMDIVFSPKVSVKSVENLENLAKRYLHIKLNVYKEDLIPKDHFVIHWPTIIKKMGPLYFIWCMRFEGKHSYFKDLAQKYGNFKNIANTLADQHQRFMYNQWRLQDGILGISIDCKSTEEVLLKTILEEYSSLVNYYSDDTKATLCSYLTYGQKYYRDFFIIDSFAQDTPVFYSIRETFIYNGVPYCIGKKYVTQSYNENLHAWLIKDQLDEFKIIDLSQLEHINSYEQHQPFDQQNYYLTLRYKY